MVGKDSWYDFDLLKISTTCLRPIIRSALERVLHAFEKNGVLLVDRMFQKGLLGAAATRLAGFLSGGSIHVASGVLKSHNIIVLLLSVSPFRAVTRAQ